MNSVNVGGIIFPSFNSTNGVAIDIFLTGCSRHCKNCHNPNLWDKDAGIRMEFNEIIRIIKSKKVVDSIAIMGGEPLEDPKLGELLSALQTAFPDKKIWLYTSYTLKDVSADVKDKCDYIKTGRYIESQKCEGRLATSNQKIYKNCEGEYAPYYSFEGGTISAENRINTN